MTIHSIVPSNCSMASLAPFHRNLIAWSIEMVCSLIPPAFSQLMITRYKDLTLKQIARLAAVWNPDPEAEELGPKWGAAQPSAVRIGVLPPAETIAMCLLIHNSPEIVFTYELAAMMSYSAYEIDQLGIPENQIHTALPYYIAAAMGHADGSMVASFWKDLSQKASPVRRVVLARGLDTYFDIPPSVSIVTRRAMMDLAKDHGDLRSAADWATASLAVLRMDSPSVFDDIHSLVSYNHADPNAVDKDGCTCVIRLAMDPYSFNSQALQLLLKHGALLDTVDHQGSDAVHWAAARGNSRALKLLINVGARVNSKDTKKRSALHRAVGGRSPDCIVELYKAGLGAQLNREASANPLQYGVPHGAAPSPLAIAVSTPNNSEIIQALLKPSPIYEVIKPSERDLQEAQLVSKKVPGCSENWKVVQKILKLA